MSLCVQCGTSFQGRSAQQAYCSTYCKKRMARRLANERGRTWQKPNTTGRRQRKKCKGCDSMSVRYDADYCSTECRFRQHKQLVHVPADQVQPLAEVKPRAKRQLEPRLFYAGYCTRCGSAFVRTSNGGVRPTDQGTYCSGTCARRAARDQRRARERSAYVEPVYRARVFRRDDYVCQLCMKPCRRDVDAHHMLAPTVDHIVALANGGKHSMSNVQTAHRICNSMKSDRLDYALPLAG